MSVNKLMSKDLVTLQVDDTLSTIRDIFNLVTFHHLIVEDEGKLVGIISDRDYLKKISKNLDSPDETNNDSLVFAIKAHEIMNRRLVTVNITSSILDVVKTFHKSRMSCLPVIDDEGKAIGIISWKDIMDALALNMIRKSK
jgi:acetoin utilization protein AcuB